jgi:signal transduction histidine kinase
MPYTALLTSAVITAVVVVIAVISAPSEFRIPLAGGTILASIILCASITATAHYRGETERARRAAATASADTSAMITAAITAAEELAASHEQASIASENRRAAAMSAFAGAAGRMQAMTTSMLAELREMEHRHGDPRVLDDLLHLDHRTAQAGRLADSIAVLSGARTGRRWAKPIAMESILRGAMGRIAGYQRVRLRAITDIAIAGHAAEGVMHTLAELLDNACNFSPPTTEVHVYAAEVPAGVVLTIEDSGLVMSESALRRAQQAVSVSGPNGRGGRAGSDLSSLTGTRLGLAVVGHLARKHGLTVSYRPSAIGGTAVVMVVPRDLITRVERTQEPITAIALPAPAELATAVEPAPTPAPAASPLPKRLRGSTLAAVHPEGLSTPSTQTAATPPASTPSAMGAFQRALAGRETDTAAPPSPSVAVENEQ